MVFEFKFNHLLGLNLGALATKRPYSKGWRYQCERVLGSPWLSALVKVFPTETISSVLIWLCLPPSPLLHILAFILGTIPMVGTADSSCQSFVFFSLVMMDGLLLLLLQLPLSIECDLNLLDKLKNLIDPFWVLSLWLYYTYGVFTRVVDTLVQKDTYLLDKVIC